jgi:cyclopropane-fatty-acyl-phospholipid synthase
MLPSPSRLRQEVAAAGLHYGEALWFGQDYAETLSRWQTGFQARWQKIAGLSAQYDTRFKRLWEYYLGYCEVGFAAGFTDVGQIVIERPSLNTSLKMPCSTRVMFGARRPPTRAQGPAS